MLKAEIGIDAFFVVTFFLANLRRLPVAAGHYQPRNVVSMLLSSMDRFCLRIVKDALPPNDLI